MKINILSPGRFHVCDLARELDAQGWDVEFYSFVPSRRTAKFGLPRHSNKSVFLFVLPLLGLSRLFPKNKVLQIWRKRWQDFFTAFYMRRSDIVISMSGNFVYTLKRAKKQGAIIIVERGSKHILEQRRILEAIPSLQGKKPVPDINVKRELEDYAIADYISVPSLHVKESFLQHEYSANQLFVNPYGVDLNMFYTTESQQKQYDVIMVGGWSYQKGCDILVDACRQLNVRLLHVGAIVDLNFPQDEKFTHIEPVDQTELVKYYNQAKVFILPSRQDGFGMVLLQALACNLPIVCTKDTGGPDIIERFNAESMIFVLEQLNKDSLSEAILKALNLASQSDGKPLYDMQCRQLFTWEAYGKRYSNFLHNIIKK